MVPQLGRRSGRKSSQERKICSWLWTWKIMVVAMLGNTRRSRVVTSTSPWKSHQSLTVQTRQKSHFHSKKKNCKDQERVWLPFWVSGPNKGLKDTKKASYTIVTVSEEDLTKIIKKFEKFEKLPSEKTRPKHEPTDSYFYLARQLAKCMMKSDNLNWHDYGGYT